MRRRSALVLMAGLVLANLLLWGIAAALAPAAPGLAGLALVAWTFGLRHAMDADHIAAIDTVTRRLLSRGRPALRVGLFFSLGHSSVVLLATLALVLLPVGASLERWHRIGGAIGSAVSIGFLLLMAVLNGFAAIGQGRALRRGNTSVAGTAGGPLARLLLPLAGSVGSEGRVFPLGFLFGLGFDTASEIALLGLGLSHAARAPMTVILLPLMFTAGMALMDSLDTVVMVRAWSWSAASPTRRARYAWTVTACSALSAGVVGAVELVQGVDAGGMVPAWLGEAARVLTGHFQTVGIGIVAAFLLLWLGAAIQPRAPR